MVRWLVVLALCGRASADDHAAVKNAIDQAHASHDWKPAVPVIAKSLAVDDFAIDAAFDAIVALGPSDPNVTIALTTPLIHDNWSDAKIPYERVGLAYKRVGRGLIPAFLALAKLPDTDLNRHARGNALERLADFRVPEMRPVWIAMLKQPPIYDDVNGRQRDPRAFFHGTALAGLQRLGWDDNTTQIFLDYAESSDDKVTNQLHRYGLFDDVTYVAKALTPAQKAKLLALAIDPKAENANAAGKLYAMYATTTAEVDKLSAAPPENPPYFFSYTEITRAVHRELACNGDRTCLITLIQTAVDRQRDTFLLERVRLDLSRTGADDAVPTALATRDEMRVATNTYSDADAIDHLWPDGCAPCAKRATTDKRITNVFTAPISYLHVGQWTGTFDPDIYAANAFVIGREAGDVGTPIADTVKRGLTAFGAYDGNVKSDRGVHGHVMWNLEEPLSKSGKFQAVSELVVEDHGVYRIRAMMIGDAIADKDAARAPAPAAITDNHGDKELEAFARSVLSSRKRFITALSSKADAIAHGNYLSDAWPAGAAKQAFAKLGGELKIHDGIHVERVADDAGFAFANVDYLSHTYRVFLVLVKDGGAWQISLAQFSLAALAPAKH